MKELTIEQKARAYDEALERVKELLSRCRHNRDRITMVYRVNDIESIFPELEESEDEKIRKWLICYFKDVCDNVSEKEKKGVLAWLDKQCEQKTVKEHDICDTCDEKASCVIPCTIKLIEQKPAESRQETKPNGRIVCEDFNEGDGYYKVNLAYLSKSQVEFIENLISSWQNPINNTAE